MKVIDEKLESFAGLMEEGDAKKATASSTKPEATGTTKSPPVDTKKPEDEVKTDENCFDDEDFDADLINR